MTACLLLPVLAGAAFKCAVRMDPLTATSADGKTTVVVMMEGKVLVYGKGQKEPRYVAKWDRFGHHLELVLSPDGSSIALVDDYAGVEVLDGKGQRRLILPPERLLTEQELENRPGKWACHPEGKWRVLPKLAFSADSVSLSVHSGRRTTFAFK